MADLLSLLQRPVAGYPLGVQLLTAAGIVAACLAIALAFFPDPDPSDEP